MMTSDQSAALFAESPQCVERNRKLSRESWRRIASSRRRLNPWFALCGGSEASEPTLRATVRSLLAGGLLRPIDGKAWGGQGTGKRCEVCADPVTEGQVEYEIESGKDGKPTVTHLRCFLIWQDESRKTATARPLDQQ